jgi:hypothetical protein
MTVISSFTNQTPGTVLTYDLGFLCITDIYYYLVTSTY